MSGDRIEHGQVTDSVIAFGNGARSTTRTNRAATTGRPRSATRGRTAGVEKSSERGEDITGQVVAKGRGASASGHVDGRWQSVRDEREQER